MTSSCMSTRLSRAQKVCWTRAVSDDAGADGKPPARCPLCSDECIARIMADFLMIFYAVWTNESGYDKHCGRKDSAAYSSSCARGSDVIERPIISITSGEEFRRPRMS